DFLRRAALAGETRRRPPARRHPLYPVRSQVLSAVCFHAAAVVAGAGGGAHVALSRPWSVADDSLGSRHLPRAAGVLFLAAFSRASAGRTAAGRYPLSPARPGHLFALRFHRPVVGGGFSAGGSVQSGRLRRIEGASAPG